MFTRSLFTIKLLLNHLKAGSDRNKKKGKETCVYAQALYIVRTERGKQKWQRKGIENRSLAQMV
jgi:hypothetical protein